MTTKNGKDRISVGKVARISLARNDGFFATPAREPHSPLYCVGQDAASNRLVCLESEDNGETWRDHAVSEAVMNPYAIGGRREVTADGWIIGSFTDQTPEGGGKVYFFCIPAARKP